MIILRCTNDNGVVQDIQIQEQIDLRLDISAIENTTIGDVYGISSQEFSIPGNNETNQFFGNLYNLGADAAVALQNSIDCQVLLNGAEVFKGKLYIKNIITDSDGVDTLYNVIVVNETVDFKFELQDTYLNQLDFSGLDHDLTYANISQSWGGGLKSGNVVYPFVNYGKPEADPDAPDFAFSAFASTGSNTIDSFESPLRLIDFKPSIRAKYIVDTIFSGSSYDYTSSFFNSSYFTNLYVLTTANDNLGPNNVSPVSQSVWVYNASGSQTIPAGNIAKVEFDAEVVDNSNNFNLTNERFTADTLGNYQYTVNVNYVTLAWAPSNNNTVTIQLRKNGISIINSQFTPNIPETGSAFLQGAVSLEAGDYLEVELAAAGKSITILNEIGKPSFYPDGYVTYFQVKGPASAVGENVDVGEQFPDDLKALDFLQGLIEKFNLVVEPVPNSRNLIKIEPYQDWIDSGVSKDWTNKIDRSEKFEISHPITEQPRTIIFSDEEDDDVLNRYSIENKASIYGSYTFTSDSDLAEGEKKIGKVFAATPVTGIPNGRTFVVPHLCTITETKDFRPMKFKPRLLYNNGLQTVPDTALGISGSTINRGTVYVRDENAVTQATTVWNQMSTLTAIPVNYNTGQDLHFNNDLYSPYFQSSANGKVKADAFRTYWATYINSLYDFDARKLTCNVYLKPTEIQNIALNDKLFIDGAYYRINRINGANLTRRDTVEVELIKILAAQYKFPKRRINTGPNTFINVVADYDSLSINGTGRYINVDTGNTVNDFTQLRQVATKDTFQLYNNSGTGSVVWDYQDPVDNTNQFGQTVLGTNRVNVGASKVSALGNNNEVKGGSETSLVVGSNNLVAENTSNVTTLGQSHTVESLSSNAQILGGTGNTISSSRESVIMGGTGSLFVNNDYAVDINGTLGSILDSDFTTAINRAQNEVIINGSGHTVINLNQEGGGLNLLNTRNNSAWLGDTYLGQGLLINSYTLNVGDGSNIFLTGSNPGQGKHETLYILNWNGLSPGTASINLPSAANNDYKGVVYTFKLASGNAGEIVRLVPFTGAQTIDGASSYSTSGSYAFVSIHASGSKWHVIESSTGTGGGGGPVTSGSFTGSFSGSFTGSLLGSASYAPNIYNTNGSLTGNRTVNLNGNNLVFSASLGESFTIVSDPSSDVSIKGLPQISGSNILYYNTSSGQISFGPAVSGSTTSSAFPFTGSAQITGSLSVTGSVRTPVIPLSISNNTASMDLSKGNAFSIQLTTGSYTLITASNIVPNQHISLLVSQSATGIDQNNGNLFFEPTQFFFPSSSQYISPLSASQKDIITFETFTFNPPILGMASVSKNLVSASAVPPPSPYPSASGGVEQISGSFRIHKFTSSADFTVHTTGSSPYNNFEVLVVAGGGGGGSRAGGGGGAGGVVYMTSSVNSFTGPTTYRMTIGAGGAGAIDGSTGRGATGGDSTVTSSLATIFIAKGGGGGGGYPYASDGDGGNGGSGGGGQSYSSTTTATSSQASQSGNSGTYGFGSNGAPARTAGGTGGGGGGASGTAPSGTPPSSTYVNGSAGKTVTISGSFTVGGGGGGGDDGSGTIGSGGTGGGGNGGQFSVTGSNGTANTGGGGGGGGGGFNNGGAGGSGLIIVKYRYQA